ncbi:MAG: hypothetical protein QOK76_09495, partial [Nitrososphaeraceae archaeon]|nr:hypothetical protein [Nitrososphaeraceae archaeon]MDW0198849.1 hypothetical protein [Nitrososphaeraceae archaeon]
MGPQHIGFRLSLDPSVLYNSNYNALPISLILLLYFANHILALNINYFRKCALVGVLIISLLF